jgi:hypothetical protein
MKKPERSFVVAIDQSAHLGVSPESVLSINLIPNRTGKEPMTYSAPIEKVYATLQRWHAKEHPTGKKRPENMVPLYRLEKDMILAAKFAIQRDGISSPVFVTLAQNAFKIARHAKEHPEQRADEKIPNGESGRLMNITGQECGALMAADNWQD